MAGVFSQLNRVSFSVVLIPGVLGFSGFVPIDSMDIILILIASTLSASIPISVLSFVNTAKHNFNISSELTKAATKLALLSILISQVLGIISGLYVLYFYWIVLFILTLGLGARSILSMLDKCSGDNVKNRTAYIYYSGLMSVAIGGIGQEWRRVFVGDDDAEDRASGFAFLSVFIALPACIGFLFPGIAVPLIEQNPNVAIWMLGYICWPLTIVIFMSATIGHFMVRQHKNLTDIAWLNHILVIYLVASIVRMITP